MNQPSTAQYRVPDNDHLYRDKKGRIRVRQSRGEAIMSWFFVITIPLSFLAFLGIFAWAVAAQDGAWTLGITIPGTLLALLVIWEMLDA